MKYLEKDGVIDHDAIETKARVAVLEIIVSWQTDALVECLSLFQTDLRSRALTELSIRLQKIEDEGKKIYIPSMTPMDSDYSAELIQEVLAGYVHDIQKSLNIPS